MTAEARQRGLLAWAHFYFLLTFRWWYQTVDSFSLEGLTELQSLPVWGLDWVPRLPEAAVSVVFEALVLLALVGACLTFSTNGIVRSRLLLWPLILAKSYFYLLDLRLFTTYHHMHLLITFLLALGASRFLLQIALAQIYLFSALGKFNDSWLEGKYLQSIPDGLPLLGASSALLLFASWAVIALELVGPVLWFSPWSRARQVSLFGFMVFHLYSGFIVGFRYPILMLGLWYFVLWPLAVPVQKNFLAKRSELPGAVLLLFTFLVGWYPQLNGSDSRYTAEGRYFSLGNMFDANRSVLFEASFQKNQQSYRIKVIRNQPRLGFYLASTEILLSEGGKPFRHLTGPLSIDNVRIDPAYFQDTHLRLVGDPYLYLYFLRRVNPENVEARLETSLNGGEKVVVFQIRGELPTFRPASRNEWIRDE